MARSCAISLPAAGRTLLLLLLGTAPPLASAFSPKMQYQARAWTPAKPTSLASVTLPGAGDVSPAPTEAPGRPDFGGVELFKRDFTKGTDTCGFAAQYKSEPWTCFRVSASCVSFSTAMGCCVGQEPDCYTSIFTSCRNYAGSASSATGGASSGTGGASSGTCGAGTLCCPSSSPSCFTWQYSTTNSAGQPGNTYSIFNCYASGGTGTLLSTPPALRLTGSATGKSESTALNPPDTTTGTTATIPGTQTSTPPPAPPASNSNSAGNNIGAIVGGAVGAVAILAAVAVAVFWLVMRHKREKAAAAAAANGGDGGAGGVGAGGNRPYPPPAGVSPGQTSVSPVTATASPQMGQNGYFAVPQHHAGPGPDGRYPSCYEPAKQQPSPVYSDPRDPRYSMVQPQHTGGSMGGVGGGGQWHAPPAMELANTNPVGSAGNRAELL